VVIDSTFYSNLEVKCVVHFAIVK